MMFSRAASLRRLVASAAGSVLSPAAEAPVLHSSPLSTTAKWAPKKAAVPAPEAEAATAPQQAARGSSSLSTTTKRAPKKAAVPAPEAEAATAPQQAARGSSPLSTITKRAPKKAAVPAPEAEAATAPQQAARGSSPRSITTKRAPKKAAVPAPEAEAATAPQQAARGSSPRSTTTKRAPKKAAVPAPEAAARDHPFPLHFDPAEVKCPTEIPFQPQIANTVHLVGTVGVLPVLEEKSKGEYQAVSVIVEEKDSVGNDSLQLWIPVIFQGDLAQIAACHLKENDLVYIVGHLSGGEATTKVEDAHSKIRIFARSLNFVESNSVKDDKLASEQDKKMASDHLAEENSPTRPFWNDLLSNPHNWLDNRAIRTNPSSAAFKHKDKGQLLWLNEFTPKDVLSRLDTLAFYNKTPKKNEISGNVMNESWWTDVFAKKKDEDLWKDLIENPTKWWDRRLTKGNPKAPDFKHKDSGDFLWLSSSPSWVLEKLPPSNNLEDLWKDVIENPTKWWDNRLRQGTPGNPKAPGFKHKDSGDFLWLSSSPSWVLEKLPLPNSATNPEDLWKDVIENPSKWWDTRLNKRNPRAPDFKHKDSGDALWLSSSPSWVLEKLPPTENTTNSEHLWKDVIENPTKWWDRRLNKGNPKAPDFTHKDSGVALWLSSSPLWVMEKLPATESMTNTDSWSNTTSLSSGKNLSSGKIAS